MNGYYFALNTKINFTQRAYSRREVCVSFQIAQISDCHLFADKHEISYQGINPYVSLEAVLAKVAQNGPDLVIVSGDVSADESLTSYQHFSHLWSQSEISAPLLVIPGNHDDLASLDKELNASAGWPVSRSAGAYWRIHALNTKAQGTAGAISTNQLDYINQQVSMNPEAHHLLVVHHHPFACGGWMDNHSWHNSDTFVAQVSKHQQIKAVIYGHIHHASHRQHEHCWYLSAPSTCWQWAISAQFSTSEEAPGYRVISLNNNGLVDSHIIRI